MTLEGTLGAVRLRITFAKQEAMRFTGNLDLQRAWERAMRRAGLPLAYSQGFNPHPRLQLAIPLPLGFTSECEITDAWFESDLDPGQALAALQRCVPPGIRVLSIDAVDPGAPATATRTQAVEYTITLLEAVPDLAARVARTLAAENLPRLRRGKAYDLRPLIEALELLPPDPQGLERLLARLAAREGHTGRPDEVLEAMGISPACARIHRSRILLA